MGNDGLNTLVLVTGPMRSGTSAVAQVVHRMGFVAAISMSPPRPPRWHPDYEDAEAVHMLLTGIWPPGETITPTHRACFRSWFADYLNRRLRHARRLWELGESWVVGIACKSPLYAPFLPDIESECVRSGVRLRVIVCARETAEGDAALEQANACLPDRISSGMRAHQRTIREALQLAARSESRGYHADFQSLLADPEGTIVRLADFLDAKRPVNISNIIQPRTCAGSL